MKMLALPKSSWKHIQNFMYKLECCRSYIPNAKLHLDIRGVFPAITTPFDKDERILYDKLEANVAKWQAVDFRGNYWKFVSYADLFLKSCF